MPGIAMSRIKQLVSSAVPDERNSSAEEKARAAKPNSLISSGSDSRMDSSSSTTDRSRGSLPLPSFRDFITKSCGIESRTSIVLWYWFFLGIASAHEQRSRIAQPLSTESEPALDPQEGCQPNGNRSSWQLSLRRSYIF